MQGQLFYQLCSYKNLLINKGVMGFYMPKASWRRGYFSQTIRAGGTSYFFNYRQIDIKRFFPFTKKRLGYYLDGIINRFEDDLGMAGLSDFSHLQGLLAPASESDWIGVVESINHVDGKDYAHIFSPGGGELLYTRNFGKPMLIPEMKIYLKPLGCWFNF